MATSPSEERTDESALWGEKLEELKIAIRECYGFDEYSLPNDKLVRLFEELDVAGVGRIAVEWLVSLFNPKSPVASAVRRGRITRSEISDLILSAQEEEVKRSGSPVSIVVCRVRDHVTLASYTAIRNGFMKLELETARRKLIDDVASGHLTGRALRNISVGACRLDCAMDRQKKFLALIASSPSDAQAETRRRCLQELLEATRACNRSETCCSGDLAGELGPTLEANVRRLRGASVVERITSDTRRDSIIEHLNNTAKSLSGRRALLPDGLKFRTSPNDCDDDSVGTDTSVVDADFDSDPDLLPVHERKSFVEARDALDIGDPSSWKEKHSQRKSLWLGKAPRDVTDAPTLDQATVDEGVCSKEVGCADKVRKSVSFLEPLDASNVDAVSAKLRSPHKNGYRASYIEAREALDLGDPASWNEKHAQRKSLWLSGETHELETVAESPQEVCFIESPCITPDRNRPSYVDAREGLDIGDPSAWKEKHVQRHSLWLSVKGTSEGA